MIKFLNSAAGNTRAFVILTLLCAITFLPGQLGLPTIAACAACRLLVAQRLMSPKAWAVCSVGLIGALALAVSARLIS